jgi:CTP:molybdopterin cytidylyltransferase MocA
MNTAVWTILLAAGGSRRLGRPKQLVRLQGDTLIRRAAMLALAVTPRHCIVVIGAAASRSRAELNDLPVTVLAHRRWRDGQAGSLAAALRVLPASASACLVLLVDQWAVDERHLRALIKRWHHDRRQPIATLVAGRLMAPAIFPRKLLPQLGRLRGDHGARDLLAARRPAVRGIAPRHPLGDLDTPADLAYARSWRHLTPQK